MCRYALTRYKPHLACFDCRTVFRRRLRTDVDPSGQEHVARCPQCGQAVADLGLDFKAPPKRDAKRWRELAALWRVGVTFHSCGCGGPGWVPRGTAALAAYLRRNREGLVGLIAHWRDHELTRVELARQRAQALASLTAQLAKLDAELARSARPGGRPRKPSAAQCR
jgi:hypothetical protein